MNGYALIICNCENLFSAERDGPILQSVAGSMGFETTHVRYMKPSKSHPGETITTLQEFKDLATRFTTEVNKRGRGFLSLSSHGYSGLKCTDGSDRDGRDEYIRVFGQVVRDGELRKWFLEPLRQGTCVFILVDTCHSGTMFDLPWVVGGDYKLEMENQLPLQADIWCFSACDDRQSAMDDIGERGYSGGLVAAVSDWVLENTISGVTIQDMVGNMHPSLRTRMSALGQTLYLSLSQPSLWSGTKTPSQEGGIKSGRVRTKLTTRGENGSWNMTFIIMIVILLFLMILFLRRYVYKK
jgi:hypothetical protein